MRSSTILGEPVQEYLQRLDRLLEKLILEQSLPSVAKATTQNKLGSQR